MEYVNSDMHEQPHEHQEEAREHMQYIDRERGIEKLNGAELQYNNMLAMFDKLTLDESAAKICESIKQEEYSSAKQDIYMLNDSSKLVEIFQSFLYRIQYKLLEKLFYGLIIRIFFS